MSPTDQPLVSIGMPTYNRCERLERAVESVLAQTHTALELTISDNGSTDGTEELCRRIAVRDPRVNYVRHPSNRGSTENFNFIFETLRGDYVMVLGDDDWIDQGYVAACLEVLQAEPEVAVVVGRSRYYTTSGEYVSELASPPEVLHDSPAERVRAYYALEPKPETFYGLLRASALRRAAPMRNVLYNDGILAATLVLAGKLRAVPDVAVHRARGGTSADWERLLRTLEKPGVQARFPQVVIAWHVFRDTAGGNNAYRSLPLPQRVWLAGQCARTTFSWRGLAFHLLGPDIARLARRPGMRWLATVMSWTRRRWGTG
jgi:glycosyltransferase involved in cell wall biosynthesis